MGHRDNGTKKVFVRACIPKRLQCEELTLQGICVFRDVKFVVCGKDV